MKKIIAMLLAAMMIIGLCACQVEDNSDQIEITLWTYPIGGWGTQATVDALIDGFEAANPGIKVNVE
ncbi:MAG: carbohydrate ABC transporter substrate-binding protein, partial [Firmicutes bacterium]|nr:carbohydrate ABC transporter substrate-binding protein [Bacillota bacterium]